jgi:hypothetical protein
MNQFKNVRSELKLITKTDASLILDGIPKELRQIIPQVQVDMLINYWERENRCCLHPLVFTNGLPNEQVLLNAILRFEHPIPCYCIYDWPAEGVFYQFPKKVVPVVPEKGFLTEEEAKKLWPNMINFKSIRTLCQAVAFGYGSINRHCTKKDLIKAINENRIFAEMVLDNVCHNGPARNSYNLAPFARALKKFPSRTPEILRAVKCFSKMIDAITKGEKLSAIYQERYMNTFEDYCLWHKDNKKNLDSSEMKSTASLFCATALKAFLDKELYTVDFRYTVINKDPFQIEDVATSQTAKQDELFSASSK